MNKHTDGIVRMFNACCKRRGSELESSVLEKFNQLKKDESYTLSAKETESNNYNPNVGITLHKGGIHVASKLFLPKIVDSLIKGFLSLSPSTANLMPKSVIDDPEIQEKSMQIISERLKLNGQRETNSGTIQDDSDLD